MGKEGRSILWRRGKLGLRLTGEQRSGLNE
jgi:hypothetical protein